MRTVTISETRQRLTEIIDAVQREPFVIRREKQDVAVAMSMGEYERLVNLNVGEFQRFSDHVGAKAQEAGITEDAIQELLRNEKPSMER